MLPAGTGADPDLFGPLTFGREIVHALRVHAVDPYSFTSDVRWVYHEWLAEAAMWLAWAAGGAPELIALKLALAATALMLSTWTPRRQRTLPDRDLRGVSGPLKAENGFFRDSVDLAGPEPAAQNH